MDIFYRKNHKFYLDESKLKPEARRTDVFNSLYAAVYIEFLGAANNPNYGQLTPLQRINKVNDFAENWLKERGLL